METEQEKAEPKIEIVNNAEPVETEQDEIPLPPEEPEAAEIGEAPGF